MEQLAQQVFSSQQSALNSKFVVARAAIHAAGSSSQSAVSSQQRALKSSSVNGKQHTPKVVNGEWVASIQRQGARSKEQSVCRSHGRPSGKQEAGGRQQEAVRGGMQGVAGSKS